MKQEKIHILSLLAALVASVIFGMSFMFSKLALAVAQPSVLLAFRFTLAVAAMTLVIAVNALVGKLRGRKLFAFDLCHKPVGKLVLLGLVQPVAYFIFENYGILYTSSAVAGTIIAAVPVCCILMDVLVLHERVTVRQVLCALGAVGGVALISVGGAVMISALGLLFLLLTMLSDTVYYGLSHDAAKRCRCLGRVGREKLRRCGFELSQRGEAFIAPARRVETRLLKHVAQLHERKARLHAHKEAAVGAAAHAEHAVHARRVQHAAAMGNRASRQAGTRALHGDRHTCGMQGVQRIAHIGFRFREHDTFRRTHTARFVAQVLFKLIGAGHDFSHRFPLRSFFQLFAGMFTIAH